MQQNLGRFKAEEMPPPGYRPLLSELGRSKDSEQAKGESTGRVESFDSLNISLNLDLGDAGGNFDILLDAQHQSKGWHLLVNPERQLSFHGLGIHIGPKQPVPDGKQRRQIGHVVLRPITVMDVVIPWGHDRPFEPVGAPHNVDVHPVVLQIVEEADRELHPPGRKIQKGIGKQIGKIDDDILRDRRTKSCKPIHVGGRMVPLMNPPDMLCVHQPMNPVMPEIRDKNVAEQAQQQRHLVNDLRQVWTDGDEPIDSLGDRDHAEPIDRDQEDIPPDQLPIGNPSRRPEQFERGHDEQAQDKHEWIDQMVVKHKLSNVPIDEPVNPVHPGPRLGETFR